MNDHPYIRRELSSNGSSLSVDTIVQQRGVYIVLAEPGAGKTQLLTHIADRLAVRVIRASRFRQPTFTADHQALLIDSLDEIARLDANAVDEILEKALVSRATTIVIAGRSAQWNEARTALAREIFGDRTHIVRLYPFSKDEQQQLFNSHWPTEEFLPFHTSVSAVDLADLLGNPQFLLLFATSYLRRGRQLGNKRQIFDDAIAQLASESNTTVDQQSRLSISDIIAEAGDLFAKLLLSGAAGVCATTIRTLGPRQLG